MSRKIKIQKKKRLHSILKGDYETLDINDKYLIATGDYTKEQLNGIIKDSSDRDAPLWDWFTLVNKKTNNIWYLDFSAPYFWDELLDTNKEEQIKRISNNWAIQDISIKFKTMTIKGGMYSLDIDDKHYDKKVDERINYYLKNNDWDKTLEKYQQDNEYNKNWNEGVQIYRGENRDDWGIVIPFDYINKTFLDVFSEAIKLFNLCKFNQESYKLILEIPFIKFLN
jgi:hypothetical protein